MKNVVIIKKDENGNAIRQNVNSPEYGHIVLSQKRVSINLNGWVNKKTFTALIKGKLDDLKDSGIAEMESLPGNIVVHENTQPFQDFDPNRDLKIAGDTGIILCTEDGEPIYRIQIYDGSGLMTDILIPHANGEEIKQVNKMERLLPEKLKRKRRTKAQMEIDGAINMIKEEFVPDKKVIEDESNVPLEEQYPELEEDEIEIVDIADNTIFDM